MMGDVVQFKVSEIFFSVQGEGRGPIRDRKAKPQRKRKHRAVRGAIWG
jgi:hypothetical protein